MNVVTLQGRLARPAAERLLPSGDRLVGYEVTVDGPDGKAETVPVVWFAAPASATGLDADQQVVVVGRVRRRFFRTAAGTQSKTEVVAEAVLPMSQTKRIRTAVAQAAALMETLIETGRE
jgi:single-strand DNA-binding protein